MDKKLKLSELSEENISKQGRWEKQLIAMDEDSREAREAEHLAKMQADIEGGLKYLANAVQLMKDKSEIIRQYVSTSYNTRSGLILQKDKRIEAAESTAKKLNNTLSECLQERNEVRARSEKLIAYVEELEAELKRHIPSYPFKNV